MMSTRRNLELPLREGVPLDEAVIELADAGAVDDVANLIARRVDMEPQAVLLGLGAPSEEPVSVLCRAAGLKINAYSAVLRMCRRKFSQSQANPAEALAAYRRLTQETAQQAVRRMKARAAAGKLG